MGMCNNGPAGCTRLGRDITGLPGNACGLDTSVGAFSSCMVRKRDVITLCNTPDNNGMNHSIGMDGDTSRFTGCRICIGIAGRRLATNFHASGKCFRAGGFRIRFMTSGRTNISGNHLCRRTFIGTGGLRLSMATLARTRNAGMCLGGTGTVVCTTRNTITGTGGIIRSNAYTGLILASNRRMNVARRFATADTDCGHDVTGG